MCSLPTITTVPTVTLPQQAFDTAYVQNIKTALENDPVNLFKIDQLIQFILDDHTTFSSNTHSLLAKRFHHINSCFKNNYLVQIKLTELLMSNGEYREALKKIQEIIIQHSHLHDPLPYIILAELYLLTDNLLYAKKSFTKACALGDRISFNHARFSEVLELCGESKQARDRRLSALVLAEKDHSAITCAYLYKLYKEKRAFTLANRAFTRAIEFAQQDPNAHEYIGEILMEMGENRKASKHFETAILFNENSSTAHSLLGRLLLLQKHFETAENHLQQAILLNPEDTSAHVDIAQIHLHKRDFIKAEFSLKTGIHLLKKKFENEDTATYPLGELFTKTKNNRNHQPPHIAEPSAYTYIGEAFMQGNNLEQAEICLKLAIDYNNDDLSAHLLLGRTYLKQRNILAVQRAIYNATKLNNHDLQIYLLVYEVFVYFKDFTHAKQTMQYLIALEPANPLFCTLLQEASQAMPS